MNGWEWGLICNYHNQLISPKEMTKNIKMGTKL